MSDSATPWTAARQDSLSSLSPGVCTNSRPLSQWCYQHLILYFPLLILPSISPQLKAFPMSLLFQLGGQIIGASASASILPMNILGWAPLGLTGLISLLSKGLSGVFSNTLVQSLGVRFFVTPRTAAHQASLSITNSWSLLKLMSIEQVMPSNHLILCCPLLLLPSILPSISVFSNESILHIRWPKYWNFSFSISPSNEYSEQISFRIDWFDLLAFQGTLKSLLQHHSSKASVLQCSSFFMVQFSYPYMTTGKTKALTRWI